jgi:hypothetical protein
MNNHFNKFDILYRHINEIDFVTKPQRCHKAAFPVDKSTTRTK